ncbi:MAG: hypothetical protein IT376_12485 [Polyangiaceae bacterium]|nr:hypothetical protein [Polyangiaceae bacterium]
MRRLVICLAVTYLLGLVPVGGCATCTTGGQSPITYSQGATRGDTYTTSAWSGEWLHFPPGRRLLLPHGLATPAVGVRSWLAFEAFPIPAGDAGDTTGTAAEAAGNQVVLERVDAEVVQLRNDTCATYYLRVEVRRDASADAGRGDGA